MVVFPHFLPAPYLDRAIVLSSSLHTDRRNRLRGMAMRTRLTWLQEKRLQNHFGGKRFSLLYKASVHGFFRDSLDEKCCNQGPALLVTYSDDHVFGAYIQESYQKDRRVSIILFAFQDTEISEYEIKPYVPSSLFSNLSPHFFINLKAKEVTVTSKASTKLGLPANPTLSIQECEVFRCEDLLDKRKMEGTIALRESLLSATKTYKPYGDMVRQVRILLLGPIGAGKSSFFNSVKSVFRGHVTHQALVGSRETGTSEKYRTYSIKDGNDGESLPFILCDSLGLAEKGGLCVDDVAYILKGHVPERYQFNVTKPITSHHPNYIHSPSLKDRIHCVVFVFDANSVEQLSPQMVSKIKSIRREVMKCGVVHVALLTNVDSMDLVTKGDFPDIYNCTPVLLKLVEVRRQLGFAVSDILVVSNYVSEWELDPVKDVLILSTLRQMLWAADDSLEDLPLE